jgi:hypothetical protein
VTVLGCLSYDNQARHYEITNPLAICVGGAKEDIIDFFKE